MANENDLIRRGDLKQALLKRSFFPAIVSGVLEEIPAVDAVEVVHGRWSNGLCTNCGAEADVQSIGFGCTAGTTRINYRETNYCHNCGAKMDGERKDNG